MSTVADAVASVRERVDQACARAERDPSTVRIVAATKTVSPQRVREALAAGIDDIGENRVQEALLKHEELIETVRWHLFGHLQYNKAKTAARLFDTIHSIDSERIATAVAQHRDRERDPVALMLEVDYSGLPARSGVAELDTFDLVRRLAGLPGIHVAGLMTIAPPVDPVAAREAFRRLRVLRDALEYRCGWALPELSMGMSDDFELAVEEGATMIRVGRLLFGSR